MVALYDKILISITTREKEMLELKPYLKLKDGTVQEYQVSVNIVEENPVKAVYIKGIAKGTLDADFGAGIDLKMPAIESYMADVRHMEWWCGPSFGTDFAQMPDETQGLIYKKNENTFGVILPVVSEKYKCVLKGSSADTVTARIFSWCDNLTYCDALAFVYAEGENPFRLLEKCTAFALKLLNNGCRVRTQRRYPEIFEYLGWCSWDALEIRVNEADLVKKCDEFRSKNIPVKWAIIDDMWGEVHDFYDVKYDNRSDMIRLMHSSKLYSFKADPKRFPDGLKKCIEKMNERGIKVGMWHPTTGYWMGIDPEGDIYRDLNDCLIQTEDGRYIHNYKQDKAYKYYSTIHDYLQQCGAEFVKIDNQSMTRRFYRNLAPVGVTARSFHNAMEASVGQHFDNAMINCMGMASEDMWNRSQSPISRCSADFQPEDSEWFIYHIMQCSYNDLIQGQFYYCDWDMWWTDDGQAVKNSVLRAISGGPIYVSDMLGRSNAEILMPLVLSDGRILRCDRPAVPTSDCIPVDPRTSGKVFKLQNMCNGSGVVAVFNLDENDRKVTGTVSPSEIDGLEGEEFAVYEYFTRSLKILKYNETLGLSLNDRSRFSLFSVVPVKDGFAPIGRIDKFISPATVKAVHGKEIELVEDGIFAYSDNGKLVIKDRM